MVQFKLLWPNDQIPPGYHLASRQEVGNNKQAVGQAMRGYQIANLCDGAVDSCGNIVCHSTRTDVCYKLVVSNSNCGSQHPTITFLLYNNGCLPAGCCLATVQEVQANYQAFKHVMSGRCGVANLCNGYVEVTSCGSTNYSCQRSQSAAFQIAKRG